MLTNLRRVIEGRRHSGYKRTCEVAQECYTFVTGDGMDKYVRRVVRRESPELFKQRCEITNHIIQSTLKNIRDVYKKGSRSNYLREIRYEGGNSDNRSGEFERIIGRFQEGISIDQWCQVRLQELNDTDPNTWIVLEWGGFDYRREIARPYPFEVPSASALDFKHDSRGDLLYLIVKADVSVPDSDKVLDRYTMYMKDRAVSWEEVPQSDDTFRPAEAQIIAGKWYVFVEHKPYNLGFVPAYRVGYERDMKTKGTTYLTPWDAAIPYFLKTIKANSELDLTVALHAHPLPIRAGDPCDATGCDGGRIRDYSTTPHTDRVCTDCDGTGFKKPTSTQEEIVISLPKNPANMPDLEKLLVYKTPSVEFIQWMDKYVDDLTRKAIRAVFNTDIFTRAEVVETATSKNIDLDNLYDALYPFMQQYSRMWEFLVKGVAKITGRDQGLTASLRVKRDGKLKSMEALLADWKTAVDSGASPVVRQYLQRDMARAAFQDEPLLYQQWLARERFNPFSGQDDTTIMYMLASDTVPRRQKVLYSNMGYIFDLIERKTPDFYKMEAAMQTRIVYSLVDAIMFQIDGAGTSPDLLSGVPVSEPDRLGKIPLAIQQLTLGQSRLVEVGDTARAAKLGLKIDELVAQL